MANIEQRRSSDGALTYRVKIRLKGQRPVSATFTRLTDAKRWAQRTEAAMRDGRYFRTNEAQKHTVADLIDRYLQEGHVASLKSGKDRQRQLLWWKAQLGHLSLADLTAAAITEARTALLAKTGRQGAPMSPSTVVRYLAALSHALSIAMRDWQWIEDTPMRKVSKPRQPRGRERYSHMPSKKNYRTHHSKRVWTAIWTNDGSDGKTAIRRVLPRQHAARRCVGAGGRCTENDG